MKLLNFTIIKLTACLILGIILGYFTEVSIKTSIGTTVAFLLITTVFYFRAHQQFTKTIWFGTSAFLSMVSIGTLTTNLHNQKNFPDHYSHILQSEYNQFNTVTFRIRETLKPNLYYDKYVVDILKINNQTTTGKTLLNIEKDALKSSVTIDEIYTSKTEFNDIFSPLNPHQFDYKDYLEKKHIYHQISLKRRELLKLNSNTHTLLGIANNIRDYINKKLKRFNVDSNELAIINALLLGQRQDISPEIYSSYANAGVIHILAVSGLHVGLILLILNRVFKPIEQLKNGLLIKTGLTVSLLWMFALIAGLSASVTRAVTMFSIVAIALNLKRPTNIYNTLAISMFVILLFKPLFLFDVGFQLSYLAVFAIVSIDPFLYKLWQPKNRVLDFYWHTLTVTISAQLGVLPLSLYYFHQFPGLFFLSNLVIIPLLGLILGFGIIIILLAVTNLLPNFLAETFGTIIHWMNLFVDWVAQKEYFLFRDIPFSIWHVIVFFIFIIATFKFLINQNFRTLKYVLISIVFIQGAFIYTKLNQPTNEFVIFHKSRHSLFGNTTNNKIIVAHDLDSVLGTDINNIKDYTVENFIQKIEEDTLKPIYQLHKNTLLVVDSLGVYNLKNLSPEYILLRQSPKINLNRLIDSLNPKQIVADGSNYKSYVQRWEAICKKKKLPFHHTGKNGAFIINY